LNINLKNTLLTGLAVLVPLCLTIYIISFLIHFMDGLLLILPDRFHPGVFLPFSIPGLGAIITLIMVFLCGLIAQSYFGNKMVLMGERLLDKIPFIRSIYAGIKQIADTMFMDRASFKKVVLFQFPSKNVYSVGFVTGIPEGELKAKLGRQANYVSVFMPTAPNPTTGLYMLMPEEELIYLDMTAEEAFALIISAGIVTPSERGNHQPKARHEAFIA
jgi:uncharacterized membrane protein